jgi:hypothetical protein
VAETEGNKRSGFFDDQYSPAEIFDFVAMTAPVLENDLCAATRKLFTGSKSADFYFGLVTGYAHATELMVRFPDQLSKKTAMGVLSSLVAVAAEILGKKLAITPAPPGEEKSEQPV